ncbi:MAG: integration host factor subunit alpha [Nitrospirae bacterium]|nr:integration host factor subunit alpha [Nitrospirota bacterium]
MTSNEKTDMARRIHQNAGIPEKEAAELLEGILELLKATLKNGESIAIVGFGTFMVRRKGPRPGRNPRTGEELTISARRVVSFRPSQVFKEHVNSPGQAGESGPVEKGLPNQVRTHPRIDEVSKGLT